MFTTGNIRFTEPRRAVVDAARFLTRFDDVRAVVCEAVQRGTCSVSDLVAAAGGRYGGPASARGEFGGQGFGEGGVAELVARLEQALRPDAGAGQQLDGGLAEG